MKFLPFLLMLLVAGCTVRGGWPRFLRPGEASDSAIKKEMDQRELASHGIPNFATVEPGIYRGGQPTEEGWRYLASIGVSNVIKLNQEKEDSDNYAKSIGMTVIPFPISLPQQLGLEHFDLNYVWVFDQLNADVNKPVQQGLFIHCEHGQDRTGLFVALYRVACEHWQVANAEAEMLSHGFHKSLHGLWEFWKKFRVHYP